MLCPKCQKLVELQNRKVNGMLENNWVCEEHGIVKLDASSIENLDEQSAVISAAFDGFWDGISTDLDMGAFEYED